MLNFMKYFSVALFIILNVNGNLVLAEELKTKTIISNGIGKDVQSAAQNAAQNALTNVVGSFVDATTVLEKRTEIKNGISEETKKIKTDIKEYSQGSIRSFEIIDKSNEDGFVKITAKVVVNIEDFRVYIKKYASDEKEIDQGLFAVIETEQKQQQNISKILNDITRPMYTGEVLEFALGEIKSIKTKVLEDPSLKERIQIQENIDNPAAVFLNIHIKVNEKFKNKFLTTIDSISKSKIEVSLEDIQERQVIWNERSPDVTDLFILNGKKAFRNQIQYRHETDYKKYNPEKYMGCLHEFINNDVNPEKKVAKKLILEFIDENEKIIERIDYAVVYSIHSKFDYDPIKKNKFYMYRTWTDMSRSLYSKPWIPVKCFLQNSYPIFNLEDYDLDLFFLINDNMKKAKKMKVRLAD